RLVRRPRADAQNLHVRTWVYLLLARGDTIRAMPYDKNDPRSQLSTAGNAPSGIPRPAQYRELHEVGPDEKHDNGSNTWWTRSQAMVIGWPEAQPGAELTTSAAGEHAVIAIDGATLQVSHDGEV